MCPFNQGDVVRVINDPRGYNGSNGTWDEERRRQVGHTFTIRSSYGDGDYNLEGHGYFWHESSLELTSKKRGVKDMSYRQIVPIKFAENTGYEVDGEFDTYKKNAINYGLKSTLTLHVTKTVQKEINNIIKQLRNDGDSDAVALMMGGKKNVVRRVIQMPISGGCEDTPYVNAEHVANTMNTMITTGENPIGFVIVRYQARRYNDYDSLLNNLKTWQVLFPGCYVLLVSENTGKYRAWKLDKELKKVTVMKSYKREVKKQCQVE
jgi:hypothetical protein